MQRAINHALTTWIPRAMFVLVPVFGWLESRNSRRSGLVLISDNRCGSGDYRAGAVPGLMAMRYRGCGEEKGCPAAPILFPFRLVRSSFRLLTGSATS